MQQDNLPRISALQSPEVEQQDIDPEVEQEGIVQEGEVVVDIDPEVVEDIDPGVEEEDIDPEVVGDIDQVEEEEDTDQGNGQVVVAVIQGLGREWCNASLLGEAAPLPEGSGEALIRH